MGVRGTKGVFWRSMIRLVAFFVAFASVQSNIVFAQTSEPDFEAPLIELEQVESGTLGDTQVFSATVTDNTETKKVSLFYRFNEDTEFREKVMQALADSSFYTARVSTAGLKATSIEYYIRAEDTTGNSVFKAYTFDPLVRELTPAPSVSGPTESATTQTAASDSEQPVVRKKSRTLYYVLGAVAAIAVIALAANSGGSSGGNENPDTDPDPDPQPSCGSGGCVVEFVVSPP